MSQHMAKMMVSGVFQTIGHHLHSQEKQGETAQNLKTDDSMMGIFVMDGATTS